MNRASIEAKIKIVQEKHSEARHPKDIKAYAEVLEKLIMMESDEEREEREKR